LTGPRHSPNRRPSALEVSFFPQRARCGLAGDLSGRDWRDAQEALQGRATTIDQDLQRLNDLYAYHRTGADNAFAWAFMRGFNTHGPDLDRRVAAANDFYRQATADGRVMTAEERQQLEQLIQFAREDVTTYRQGLDAAGQAVGTLTATAGATLAGVAVIWATGGTATPLVLVMIKAAGGATGQVIGNVLISGRSYDVEMLPVHVTEGFVNGATLAFSLGSAPHAATPIGRVLQGAAQGSIDGAAAGFVGGIVGTLLQDGVWSDGLWSGMVRTLEGGALSALTGGLAGGVLGGILGLFTRGRLGSGSLHSDATVPWQEIHPSIRDETLALQRRLNSELGVPEMAVN
jgi:hypothetical protein